MIGAAKADLRRAVIRTAARAHGYLGFTLKTPANDERCAGCGQTHCNCPDPVWRGVIPEGAA